MEKQTRIILVSSSILAIIILGLGLWIFFSKKTENSSPFPVSVFDFFNTGEGVLGGLFGTEDTTQGETTNPETAVGKTGLPALRQLYPSPVSGATFTTLATTDDQGKKTEKVVIRILERSSGNIFDVDLDSMKSTRVTNTTIPEIQEVVWGEKGTSLLSRSISADTRSIDTVSLHVVPGKVDVTSTDENENMGSLSALFSKNNILSASSSPDGNRIFAITKTSSGSKGERFSFGNQTPVQLFSSPLTEWLIQWPRNDSIYIATKASSGIPGYLYLLNPEKGGTPSKVAGNVLGMTALMSPVKNDGLIGSAWGTTMSLSLFSDGNLSSLPLTTLPEKCAWNTKGDGAYCGVPLTIPQASYPDAWYQGTMSFEDSIWFMNTETMETLLLATPSDYGVSTFDIIQPSISSDEKFFLFINKHDMTPWILELNY